MKPLYISATGQDSGKTSIICGLMQVLRRNGYDPGYIKPVGQRYVVWEVHNVDEDAILVWDAFKLPETPEIMSPVAIPAGFTTRYIENPDVKPLEDRILSAYSTISRRHPFVLVEGTGHAGVGSCFNLSNARVAQMLGAKAVIVAPGGIGRPIDEVALSLNLFRQYNVEVLGVILNKTMPEKYDKIKRITSKGFELLGTKLLGTMPYQQQLSSYTVKQISEEFNYGVLCGSESLHNKIEHTVVAAMEPQNVLHHIEPHTLIITPGDRIDNILLTLVLSESGEYREKLLSGGLILTGGLKPETTILSLLFKSRIPVLTASDDTFEITAAMKDLNFKIRSDDTDKISATYELVRENIDADYMLERLQD